MDQLREAQIQRANSQLSQAQAEVESAEAEQVKTQLDVNKYRPLAEQKAVTQREYCVLSLSRVTNCKRTERVRQS